MAVASRDTQRTLVQFTGSVPRPRRCRLVFSPFSGAHRLATGAAEYVGFFMARPGLRNHPKFLRLCYLLAEPEPHVYGYLGLIWETGYESGNPIIGDEIDVELTAKYPGERGKLFKALLDTRFIDALGDGKFEIHDLFDHAPDYVTKRAEREGERQKKGKLLSQIRREAGQKGAQARWENGKPMANGGQLPSPDGKLPFSDGKPMANVLTPAPAPAPAPVFGEVSPNPSSPDGGVSEPTKKKRKPPAEKKPRPRNPLFDAIVEITGADPVVNGGQIGKVAAAFAKAEPPYTPDEVRRLPDAIKEKKWPNFTLTVGAVEKHIGLVRLMNRPDPSGEPETARRARILAEREAERREYEGAVNSYKEAANGQADEPPF